MPRFEVESHASAYTMVAAEAEALSGAEPYVTLELQAAGRHASTVFTLDDARRFHVCLEQLIAEVTE